MRGLLVVGLWAFWDNFILIDFFANSWFWVWSIFDVTIFFANSWFWVWPKNLPIDLFDFRSMTFSVECRFFRLDRRCPLGGGVGADLLKWDFVSRVAPIGIRKRNGEHG